MPPLWMTPLFVIFQLPSGVGDAEVWWDSNRGGSHFEGVLRWNVCVSDDKGNQHKLLNVSLKSDMMFASNVWPFSGNFGFWKPYCLHTMDRLWSTSGTWDGFSQLRFLLQISPIPWAWNQGATFQSHMRFYGFSPCWPLRFSDGLCQEETLYD